MQPVAKPPRPRSFAEDIPARPRGSVVIVIITGAEAGRSIGVHCNQFTVGFSDDCDVRIQSPAAEMISDDGTTPADFRQSELPETSFHIRRRRDGWIIQPGGGDRSTGVAGPQLSHTPPSILVNQRLIQRPSRLRSGDVIRLSVDGPDLQFYLQSGSPPVDELARRYLLRRAHDVRQDVSIDQVKIDSSPAAPALLPFGSAQAAPQPRESPRQFSETDSLVEALLQPPETGPKSRAIHADDSKKKSGLTRLIRHVWSRLNRVLASSKRDNASPDQS